MDFNNLKMLKLSKSFDKVGISSFAVNNEVGGRNRNMILEQINEICNNVHYDYVDKTDTIVYHNNRRMLMNFYSIRDLRTESKNMWSDLKNGDEVILTNNGKPSAIMIDIPEGCFDETLQAIRQTKAMIALNNMRAKATKEGYKSLDEINSLIKEARKNK